MLFLEVFGVGCDESGRRGDDGDSWGISVVGRGNSWAWGGAKVEHFGLGVHLLDDLVEAARVRDAELSGQGGEIALQLGRARWGGRGSGRDIDRHWRRGRGDAAAGRG